MPRPSDSDTLKDIIALTKYTMGFVPFTFIDFIDIILVAAIMFWIYRATRGTNAPYIISGIIMIYLMWVVVRTLNMELLSNILGSSSASASSPLSSSSSLKSGGFCR